MVSHKSRCRRNLPSRLLIDRSVVSISRLKKFVTCWRSRWHCGHVLIFNWVVRTIWFIRSTGLKSPRGILLHGPPVTGKTHLARAITSSAHSSVLVINGAGLSSAYHGESESKLRDMFKQVREKSPWIVVLVEVGALPVVPWREEGSGDKVEKRIVATL